MFGLDWLTCETAQETLNKNGGKMLDNGTIAYHLGECSVCHKYFDEHPGKGRLEISPPAGMIAGDKPELISYLNKEFRYHQSCCGSVAPPNGQCIEIVEPLGVEDVWYPLEWRGFAALPPGFYTVGLLQPSGSSHWLNMEKDGVAVCIIVGQDDEWIPDWRRARKFVSGE